MTRAARVGAAVVAAVLLAAACARDVPAQPIDSGRWRGDVSWPGLPAIGIAVDVDASGARMISAPNMGFPGAPLESFARRDGVITFDWFVDSARRHCVLTEAEDGSFVGPCTVGSEPAVGFRMVPPGSDAPTGLARALLEMSSVRWALLSDDGRTRVFAESDDSARVDIAAITATVVEARTRNSALFDHVAAEAPLEIFMVGDRERMQALVGHAAGGWTDPLGATVVLTGLGTPRVALVHEISHAISFEAWGPPYDGDGWLREGLATWIAGECRGSDLHDLARGMRRDGALLPLRALIDEFNSQDDVISYIQSGSLVGYIIETHGADAFRRVWTEGEDGLGAAGLDVDTLEREWLDYLAASAGGPADWRSIRGNGCG